MNLKSLHMNVHSSDVDNVSFITVTLRCQSVLFTGIYAAMWNSDQMDFMQVQYGYGGFVLSPFLRQEIQDSSHHIEITGAMQTLIEDSFASFLNVSVIICFHRKCF